MENLPGGAVPGTRATPWKQQDLRPCFPKLSKDVTVDVAIIGGGLSGLCTAFRLAKAGKSVAVLEARVVGGGLTGKSLGMASLSIDDYYKGIEQVAGPRRAAMVALSQAESLEFLTRTTKQEGIDCSLEHVPGYLFAAEGTGAAGAAGLREEYCAARRAGVPGVRMEAPGGAFGERADPSMDHIGEALVFPRCVQLDPVKLAHGLAEAVVRKGGQIFEDSRAKGGLTTGPANGVVQLLGNPHTVTARDAVVLATRSPINRDQLWVHNRQLPTRAYCMAFEVPHGSVKNVQYNEYGPNPHFARVAVPATPSSGATAASGGGGGGCPAPVDWLLVMGESHQQGMDQRRYGDRWGSLECWTRRRFPQAGRAVLRWSNQDYHPADMLGLYGRDPFDFSNVPIYIITGHSGQDITGSCIGSAVVSSMILGKTVAYAEAYRPSRFFFSLASLARYASELTVYFSTVGIEILKHVTPRRLDDLKGFVAPSAVEEKLAPGEGTVVQHGWRKKALYRDEGGTLHLRSAVCTHLGCCVEWNPLDKTLDCPCHGSIYDACGHCIHAPAVADLEDLGTKPPAPPAVGTQVYGKKLIE